MDSLSYKRLKKIVIEEAELTNVTSQSVTGQQRNGPTMVIFTDDFIIYGMVSFHHLYD